MCYKWYYSNSRDGSALERPGQREARGGAERAELREVERQDEQRRCHLLSGR